MQIHDVSVAVRASMPVYPGDPGVELEQWAALERGDAANVTMLRFGAHTGTHVDAPAHFIEGAPKVEAMPLDVLIGEARVVKIPSNVRAITREHVTDDVLLGATRVLFRTRNSAFWADAGKGFRTGFTYLEPQAAEALVRAGVRLVGIDYLSIEAFGSKDFKTHKTLLGNGIVIVEGLNLDGIEAGVYELICLPLKIAEGTGDGAPARAVLRSD